MPPHPALETGRVAVITGAASGIGLAVAERLAALGMKICLADVNIAALEVARSLIVGIAGEERNVLAMPVDVSDVDSVRRLKDAVYDAFGDVAFLMNNAGTEGGGGLLENSGRWRDILGVNLWGVVNGIQVFVPAMLEGGRAGAVVSTGSKQGITTPPGDTAYNVSKAGVKVATEALAHELRNVPGASISAHLLVPGFTFTGFTRAKGVTEKPAGAWTAGQVADFMLAGMAAGDFYIICPDNDVTRDLDNRRIRWAAEDITENRPPLSRWHPDYKQAFADYLKR